MKTKKNNQKFSSSTVIPLIICMISFPAFFASSCGKEEKKVVKELVRPIKMVTVGTGDNKFTRSLSGTVQASQNVDLAFKVSGPLIEFPVKEGQKVDKGAVLARILPRDFKIALDKAKAGALEAEQQYRRYKELYIQKQVSKADFDKYKRAHDVARAQQEDARHALEDTYLRAPFKGVIGKKYVDNFQEVRNKQPVVNLQDLSSVEIHIFVPEAMMAEIKDNRDGKAIAEFASAPGKQFKLSLKEFATKADPGTQTYEVTLLMPQPEDINILPGMTANVVGSPPPKLGMDTRIIIPAIAVVADDEGKSCVWVVDSGAMKVRRRKVTTGDLSGTDSIRIIAGLKAGEKIVIAGVSKLREGMKVRPLNR